MFVFVYLSFDYVYLCYVDHPLLYVDADLIGLGCTKTFNVFFTLFWVVQYAWFVQYTSCFHELLMSISNSIYEQGSIIITILQIFLTRLTDLVVINQDIHWARSLEENTIFTKDLFINEIDK